MAELFILWVAILGSGSSQQAITFKSEASCLAAATQVVDKLTRAGYRPNGLAVECFRVSDAP